MAHLPISLVFYRLNLKGWFLELLAIPMGIEYPYNGMATHSSILAWRIVNSFIVLALTCKSMIHLN